MQAMDAVQGVLGSEDWHGVWKTGEEESSFSSVSVIANALRRRDVKLRGCRHSRPSLLAFVYTLASSACHCHAPVSESDAEFL